MKKFLFLLLAVILVSPVMAQTLSSDPALPVADQAVTIYFDASGTALESYTGTLYTHTGLIINGNSSWANVIGEWGVNSTQPSLTSLGNDLYSLEIVPSIREYYGASSSDEIEQMAFVFRSEDAATQSADLFLEVFESGLNIVFVQPDLTPVLVASNDSIIVEIRASESDTIYLYIDNVLIKQSDSLSLMDTIIPEDDQSRWVKAVAKNNTEMVADSFLYHVRPDLLIEEIPEGNRDGINYKDDETVILSLLAPGKEYVYVIGDFNDWEISNDYFMKQTPDGERFWLEIPGLTAGQEYIFQYFIDGNIRVGDPYADKVSDPWNDQYISMQTYPGLIDYPYGKTNGVATVLQTAQEEYLWEIDDFEVPKTTDLVIYEMLIRDFTTKHSYAAVTDTLDYLARLGINVLELMPVNEFEGNSSWGYNPSYYFAPDKYYGPKNELKKLVDECHKRGIAVVLDIVLNHSYNQSPLAMMYWSGGNPAADNPWYNEEHNFSNPDAQWGNDFNHESIYTQNFIDSVNSYWMSEYRFDGFRFDFTKGFSNTYHGSNDPWGSNYDEDRIAILKRMAEEIWERNNDAILILEHLSENSEEKELANYGFLMWGNANYNYGEASMSYTESGKSDFSWISYQKRGWNDPHVVGYMESHDEERIMYKNYTYGNSSTDYDTRDSATALSRSRLINTFFYTIPGPKMLWQFGELGYDYSIDYNGRLGEKPVRWDYYDEWRRNYNYKFISSLIELKKTYDVFETDDYHLDVYNSLKRIRLYSEGMNVLVMGNFDMVTDEITTGFPHAGMWYEYFSGDSLDVVDVDMEIELKAGEYRLYTDEKLQTPDIGTGIEPASEVSKVSVLIYPNPLSSDAVLQINSQAQQKVHICVYNMLGSEVLRIEESLNTGIQKIGLNLETLNSGIYFCNISSETFSETIKFIKQ